MINRETRETREREKWMNTDFNAMEAGERKWLAWAYLLTDCSVLTLSTNTHVHVSHLERTPDLEGVKGVK